MKIAQMFIKSFINKELQVFLYFFISMTLVADSINTIEGSKIKNARLKMLNGKYAKLYDFNRDGPMIINFWTTW